MTNHAESVHGPRQSGATHRALPFRIRKSAVGGPEAKSRIERLNGRMTPQCEPLPTRLQRRISALVTAGRARGTPAATCARRACFGLLWRGPAALGHLNASRRTFCTCCPGWSCLTLTTPTSYTVRAPNLLPARAPRRACARLLFPWPWWVISSRTTEPCCCLRIPTLRPPTRG